MTLTQFVLILKARWRLILGFALAGLLFAIAGVLVLPKNYSGVAQVLVNVRTPDTVQMLGDAGVTPQIQPDYLSTQVDVIKSDRVATEAVKRLNLTSDPEAMRGYRASASTATPEVYFADRITSKLKVVPSSSSRVISIIYSSPEPEAAATVANAFAQAYQTVSVDLQRDPERQAQTYYAQSVADLGARLTAAQSKLSARRAELGVTALPDGTDADDARLTALSQQLASAQATQAAQNARTSGGALPDATANPVIQGMEADIARLEAQRRQLATFAGPNNVDYQQVSNQIATLRSELAKQQSLIVRSTAVSSAQSNAGVASLQSAINVQRQKVIISQRARGEIAALEQDVTNLKTTYEGLVGRQSQSALLSQSGQTNVTILSPAVIPLKPSGLSLPLKIVAGLLLGTIVGLAIALVLEFLDQRIRAPDDGSVWLGIPNLGGVRAIDAPAQRRLGHSPQRYLPRTGEGEV